MKDLIKNYVCNVNAIIVYAKIGFLLLIFKKNFKFLDHAV